MKKIKLLIVFFIGLFIFYGCTPMSPIYDITYSSIQGNNNLTLAQVEQAIFKAAIGMDRRVTRIESGLIEVIFAPTNFVAIVNIRYSTSSYSITYKESSNLNSDGINIRNSYNILIRELDEAIQNEISNM